MFIVTPITDQSKLWRSETKTRYTLRSYGAVNVSRRGIYKHFIPTGFIGPRNLLKKRSSIRRGRRDYAERRAHDAAGFDSQCLNLTSPNIVVR